MPPSRTKPNKVKRLISGDQFWRTTGHSSSAPTKGGFEYLPCRDKSPVAPRSGKRTTPWPACNDFDEVTKLRLLGGICPDALTGPRYPQLKSMKERVFFPYDQAPRRPFESDDFVKEGRSRHAPAGDGIEVLLAACLLNLSGSRCIFARKDDLTRRNLTHQARHSGFWAIGLPP